MNIEILDKENRILIEAALRPVQGTRFQPTGFPNMGAATYQMADGTQMCLVESSQSMANRMEAVCWDRERNSMVHALKDLPHIEVRDEGGKWITSSVLEAHRINSPYILEGKDQTFLERLKADLKTSDTGRPDLKALAITLYKYDPNSLIHGVFLAKSELARGQLRVPRALSSFIEASGVTVAASGGLKRDDIDMKGDPKKGYGHVPFSRDEYTGHLKAYFNLDLAQIRGYGLGKDAEKLLIALSLYKIRKVLEDGLRLRTACDLEVDGDVKVIRPSGYVLPTTAELENALPTMVAKENERFAGLEERTVRYIPTKEKKEPAESQ